MSDKVFVFHPFDWYGKVGEEKVRGSYVTKSVDGFKGVIMDKDEAWRLVAKNKELLEKYYKILEDHKKNTHAFRDLADEVNQIDLMCGETK